jgi:hypothetical protein
MKERKSLVCYVKMVKPFDIVAIGLVLSITIFSAVFIYAGTGSEGQVTIRGESATWIFPQDHAEIVSVAGPLGETVVELSGRRARVVSSPCGNQTCVSAGFIQFHGQWLACLPNRVLVSVEGSKNDDGFSLDGATW